MNVSLTPKEQGELRALQKQQRGDEGYVKITVVLMLDAERSLATMAQDLGLDETKVYRYAHAYAALGPARYLAHKRPGYWGLLTSAQLARLCHEVNTHLYTELNDYGLKVHRFTWRPKASHCKWAIPE